MQLPLFLLFLNYFNSPVKIQPIFSKQITLLHSYLILFIFYLSRYLKTMILTIFSNVDVKNIHFTANDIHSRTKSYDQFIPAILTYQFIIFDLNCLFLLLQYQLVNQAILASLCCKKTSTKPPNYTIIFLNCHWKINKISVKKKKPQKKKQTIN